MYLTEGIVLSRNIFGEADELFSIYTRDFGKVRARAQGVKKNEAKLKGHMELLNLSTVGFVTARHGERLVHASLQEFWSGIRADFETIQAAYYIVALIDAHCLENEPDVLVWDLLLENFKYLEVNRIGRIKLLPFIRNFERKFGVALGYEEEDGVRVVTEGVASLSVAWYNEGYEGGV